MMNCRMHKSLCGSRETPETPPLVYKTSFLIRGAHRALGKIGIVQDRETLFKTIYRRITDFAIDLFRERLIRLLLLTGLCILIGFVVKNVVVRDMVHRGLFPVMVYPLTFLIREIQSLFN